jgi:hypothetical protein
MWAASLRQKTTSVASLRLWPIITGITGPHHRNTQQAGSYGQYRQEILLPGSFLHAFATQTVLLSLTARGVAGTIPLNISAEDVESALGHAIAELRALWGSIRDSIKSPAQ